MRGNGPRHGDFLNKEIVQDAPGKKINNISNNNIIAIVKRRRKREKFSLCAGTLLSLLYSSVSHCML